MLCAEGGLDPRLLTCAKKANNATVLRKFCIFPHFEKEFHSRFEKKKIPQIFSGKKFVISDTFRGKVEFLMSCYFSKTFFFLKNGCSLHNYGGQFTDI